MKRVILLSAILLASSAASTGTAHATEVGSTRTFGLGLQLADPTAIIGKVFLDRNDALDFGFGFWGNTCWNGNGRTYYCSDYSNYYSLHLDYLFEDVIVDKVVKLDWHVGAGGRMEFWRDNNGNTNHQTSVLARAPIGLDLTFRRPSWLEVYLEIAPALRIVPGLDLIFDVGLGARAYFL